MRAAGLARLALGVLLLGRPTVAVRLSRTPGNREVRALTRLLGARYAAQGALDLAVAHDGRLDATVELLHAGSMVVLAGRSRSHARLALLSAAAATSLAAVDLTPGARHGR